MVDLFGHHEHMLHLSGFACFQLGLVLESNIVPSPNRDT